MIDQAVGGATLVLRVVSLATASGGEKQVGEDQAEPTGAGG